MKTKATMIEGDHGVTDYLMSLMVGLVDGFNRVFRTPGPYWPGSVRVFVNGIVQSPLDEDGWVETGFSEVTLREPPFAGDQVLVSYRPM
jgi:hypothetical protein